MYSFIMFGNREQNTPKQCYHVGFEGCKSISEVVHETIGGIDRISYKVEFNDAEPIEIDNTILVSA